MADVTAGAGAPSAEPEVADIDARTIPAALERAAARFGEREGLVDGDRRLTFAELAAAADDAARAYVASGIEPGDRVAIWAPNMGDWVVAALGAFRAGAVVVTVNTRFKGSEAAHVIETAQARLLVTVTDFLDTDYVALLSQAGMPACLEQTVVLAGPVPGGAVGWPDFLARGADVDPALTAERAAAIAPDDVSTIIFTSGTTGKPKGAMLRHGASVRAYNAWADRCGAGPGRPLPDRQPVLPLLRAQGRHPRLPDQGRDDRPPPGVRRAQRDAARRRGAHHDAARRAGDLPDDPRPPRPGPLRPVDAAAGRHRGGHGAGGDDPAHGLGADLPQHRDRLRAHRVDRHHHDVPPHRRPRDHRQHGRAPHPRRRGHGRRRGRQGARRRASPAR